MLAILKKYLANPGASKLVNPTYFSGITFRRKKLQKKTVGMKLKRKRKKEEYKKYCLNYRKSCKI